jgi:hypothetical protein
MKDCSVNYSDTGDFDHTVWIVEAPHLNQRNRRKILTEHPAIDPTQRRLIVKISLQVSDINRQYRILVWTSSRCGNRYFEVLYDLGELCDKIPLPTT